MSALDTSWEKNIVQGQNLWHVNHTRHNLNLHARIRTHTHTQKKENMRMWKKNSRFADELHFEVKNALTEHTKISNKMNKKKAVFVALLEIGDLKSDSDSLCRDIIPPSTIWSSLASWQEKESKIKTGIFKRAMSFWDVLPRMLWVIFTAFVERISKSSPHVLFLSLSGNRISEEGDNAIRKA